MARHIAAKWKDYGFDQVELTRYDVLLNTPHKDLKNKVEIHRNGEVVFEAQPYEKASDTICVYFSTLFRPITEFNSKMEARDGGGGRDGGDC